MVLFSGDARGFGGGRLAAIGAGAIVAPIRRSAVPVDQGELELSGPAEIRATDRDAALVVDQLRDLRARAGNQAEIDYGNQTRVGKLHNSDISGDVGETGVNLSEVGQESERKVSLNGF